MNISPDLTTSPPNLGGARGGIIFNDKTKKNFRRSLRNNMPAPEVVLWSRLRGKQQNGLKFRRQYSVGGFVLDFYCPSQRLAIEIDGDSHYTNKAINYDKIRQDFLASRNIRTIRFTNQDIFENIDGVLTKIIESIL